MSVALADEKSEQSSVCFQYLENTILSDNMNPDELGKRRYTRLMSDILDKLKTTKSGQLKNVRLFYLSSSISSLTTASDKILSDAVKDGGAAADLAMKELVERHIGYVKQEAAKGTGLSFNDALNRGIEGLWTAAMKYDESRGASFLTYARQWVHRNTKNRGSVADTALTQFPTDGWVPEDKSDEIKAIDLKNDMARALSKLDASTRDVVYNRFFVGLTLDELSSKLNISKNTAIKRLKSGCGILKEELKGYGSGLDNV